MPLIKRYPNRKLYDTEAKRYVTLQYVTLLIQEGEEVQVVDYESGEDLTNLTLTQIILEQEKRNASSLIPRFLLTSIIRAGGNRLTEVRRTLEAKSGSAAEEFESVREQADAAVEQGQQMIDQVQALLRIDERIADVLHLLNMPSVLDVQALQKRIDRLTAKLESTGDAEKVQSEAQSIDDESSARPNA